MRTQTVLLFSMLAVYAFAAGSSSSAAAVVVNATSSSVPAVLSYTCSAGDEKNCIAIDAKYCCMATKIGDSAPTYYCAPNPSKYTLPSVTTSFSAVSISISISVPTYTTYCAFGNIMKVSLALLSAGIASLCL